MYQHHLCALHKILLTRTCTTTPGDVPRPCVPAALPRDRGRGRCPLPDAAGPPEGAAVPAAEAAAPERGLPLPQPLRAEAAIADADAEAAAGRRQR